MMLIKINECKIVVLLMCSISLNKGIGTIKHVKVTSVMISFFIFLHEKIKWCSVLLTLLKRDNVHVLNIGLFSLFTSLNLYHWNIGIRENASITHYVFSTVMIKHCHQMRLRFVTYGNDC